MKRCVFLRSGEGWRRLAALVLVAALGWEVGPAVAVAAPAAAAVVQPQWKQTAGVFHTTLPNGMGLWVKPDRRSPTVAHMLWVRVGAMDEPEGQSGVAHVLEHMMFKGTPRLAPGEYSRRVAGLGGRDNAFTSRDATVYHQQVPAAHLETVMELEADRFAHNQWEDAEFWREMEVIKEERRQRVEDQPAAKLFEALSAVAFQAHPYRRPVIGWMADLEGLKPEDVRAFYRRWYVPGNAAVVVVGDVEPDAVWALALKHYGPIAPRPVPERRISAEPPQNGMRTVQTRAAAEQPMVVLAYQAPRLLGRPQEGAAAEAAGAVWDEDALALILLAAVLDGHEGARLGRSLVQPTGQARLADAVDAAYSGSGRGPAQFLLSATPSAGRSTQEVVQALEAQLAEVAAHGVSEAELARAKNQWRAAEVFKLDSVFAQAMQLGSQWLLGQPPDGQQRLIERLQSVSAQAVQAAAQRVLRPERLTRAELLPDAQALAQRRQAVAQRPRLDARH